MKVFITGGAGFIGSHLATRCLDRGDRVLILDDLSTGSMDNIEHLLSRPGFEYRIGSCLDVPLVSECVDRCDTTVHLAAAVGVRLIVEQPVHTIETNIGATEVVLAAAAKKQKLVLVTSTSEVYGKSAKIPFAEGDDLQLGPTANSRWAYACSKALDEWLALAYYREKKLPVIIARLFNTVGPRQTGRYGMVLPTDRRTNSCRSSPADRLRLKPLPEARSPSTEPAPNRAASVTSRMPWRRCCVSSIRPRPWAASSTSAPTRKSRSSGWPSLSGMRPVASRKSNSFRTPRPMRKASRTWCGGSPTARSSNGPSDSGPGPRWPRSSRTSSPINEPSAPAGRDCECAPS